MSLFVSSKIALRGIILSVHSTLGGDQLVFRYPPVHRKHVTGETLEAVFGKKAGSQTVSDVKVKDPPANPTQPPLALTPNPDYSPYSMPSVILCSILSPKMPLCDRLFEIVIDDFRFIGRPTLLTTTTSPSDSTSTTSFPSGTSVASTTSATGSSGKSAEPKAKDELTMFNVVLVLDKEGTTETEAEVCRRIVKHLAVALKHEQDRCGFLNKEVFKMLHKREGWLVQYHKMKEKKEEDNTSPDHTQLTFNLLDCSPLAMMIKEIFHGLKDEGFAHVTINSWLSLSLSVRDPDQNPTRPMRPYQTILVQNPADCLSRLPQDASPALRRLLEAASPTKSFRELQVELGIPIAQLYRLSAHLVYWGQGRIMDALTKNNTFVLNPDSSASNFYLPYLAQEFEAKFNVKLTSVLQRFSLPKRLGEHIGSLMQQHGQSMQRDFVEMVIWLLTRELLVQMQTFIYLITPTRPEEQKATDAVPLAPVPLTRHELNFVMQYDNQTPEFALFKRLCPYFRGQHHLTEIAWRENVSKEDLSKALQMFKNLIVQINHPEGS